MQDIALRQSYPKYLAFYLDNLSPDSCKFILEQYSYKLHDKHQVGIYVDMLDRFRSV